MVHNLRAYFKLHVITIRWMMCAGKIELTGMSQIPRWSSTRISGDLYFLAKIKQQYEIEVPRVAKSWHRVVQGWHLPPHGYGPEYLL